MSTIDTHPILGQLKESDRRSNDVAQIQEALEERRRVLERDGKVTTVVSGLIGISALFFMKPLSFYIILALLVLGLPAIWRHLVKEAREFGMTDEEVQEVLDTE